MKNLKKLSRTNLKEIQGGAFTGLCHGEIITVDNAPGAGMPYDCGCNTLIWCESLSACIQRGQFSSSSCKIKEL
ncbi:bacteriocin-like protein [Elizabethkingia miricola]|uniref:bacteriocin-like protein n=1 Tax=Elizabethkingia miricola TaxID=172045 RepID=UPI003891BD84